MSGIRFRQSVMHVCNAASVEEMRTALGDPAPETHLIRPPESGLVMLRGRMGGDGAPFNIGEATVTRCTVALPGGEIGHACQLGRDLARAQLAATLDAFAQTTDGARRIAATLLPLVEARIASARATRARETAATRVDFFTLAREQD
jgi:alpha-D-ribose 1-methylphosphonate 5-triphosphate synthase subunit PhnG